MKSFAQTLDLKNDPQMIAAYVEWHTKVYPEVLLALRKVGVSKMKIFLLGTHLFMYYEACPSNLFSPPKSTIKAPDDFDPTRDFQAYTQLTPRAGEWDTFMRTFQQKVAEAAPEDEWWSPMPEVFDLETQLAALPTSE